MKHFASPEFWKFLASLPAEVQQLAHKNYELLKADPHHPSLRLKRIGPYWSARVGRGYRVLGKDVPGGILWGWIGPHAEYDKLLK